MRSNFTWECLKLVFLMSLYLTTDLWVKKKNLYLIILYVYVPFNY